MSTEKQVTHGVDLDESDSVFENVTTEIEGEGIDTEQRRVGEAWAGLSPIALVQDINVTVDAPAEWRPTTEDVIDDG